MRNIFGLLATAAGIYSILIIARIIISWFGSFTSGKPVDLLKRVTDPYLDWWRRNLNIRVGFLDFSVLAAIAGLSLVQNILSSLSRSLSITLGNILTIVLISAWNIVSFIIGFCFVVLVLRLIAYLTNRNIYSPFWKMVDSVSQPVLYRLNRIIFGNKIVNFLNGIIISSLLLVAIWIAGNIAVQFLANILSGLPI